MASERAELRLVAFGGGTGLPVLLEGLRARGGDAITAVVTVADDGGSSGRLRRELGIAPPGDVRNCLVALAGRTKLAEVFDYRFESGADLRGHAVGNIVIAALTEMSGDFGEGVAQAARFLRVEGTVYPAATESLTLVVEYADGAVTRGESALHRHDARIARVGVEPSGAAAPEGVLAAIAAADLVVLAPGSLYTSTIPALLGGGVRERLERFGGPVVYPINLMTQPRETVGLTASEHVEAITGHVGPIITDVLLHSERLRDAVLTRYRADGALPVERDRPALERLGVRVHEAALVSHASDDDQARHDPHLLARAVHTLVATGRA